MAVIIVQTAVCARTGLIWILIEIWDLALTRRSWEEQGAVRSPRKNGQQSRRKTRRMWCPERPVRLTGREGVIKCCDPSLLSSSHKCSRTAMALGTPLLFSERTWTCCLPHYRLWYYHLQKCALLTPSFSQCFSPCSWIHLRQTQGNLCRDKKGQYQGESIPVKPLLFFHLPSSHSANIPGPALILQPPLISHKSQLAQFFYLMLFWLIIILLCTRKQYISSLPSFFIPVPDLLSNFSSKSKQIVICSLDCQSSALCTTLCNSPIISERTWGHQQGQMCIFYRKFLSMYGY